MAAGLSACVDIGPRITGRRRSAGSPGPTLSVHRSSHIAGRAAMADNLITIGGFLVQYLLQRSSPSPGLSLITGNRFIVSSETAARNP